MLQIRGYDKIWHINEKHANEIIGMNTIFDSQI